MSKTIKFFLLTLILLLIITTFSFADSTDNASVSWEEHYKMIQSFEAGGWGKHVLLTDTSEVTVSTVVYNEGKTVDIYYPPDMDFESPRPVLILIGLSDVEVKSYYGVPYKYTEQALGWAQSGAEKGFAVLAHETGGSPKKDLIALAAWVRTEGGQYGLNGKKIGLWSNSDACDTAIKGIRPDRNGIPRPSASFAVFYPGNLTAYSSMDPDVPILVVTAETDASTDMAKIEKFIGKMEAIGSSVTHIHHTAGGHAFETREDTAETRDILELTFSFMLEHTEN